MEFINRVETVPVTLGNSRRTYFPELLNLRGEKISSIALMPSYKWEENGFDEDNSLLDKLTLTIVSESREVINRISLRSLSKIFTSNSNIAVNRKIDFSKCFVESNDTTITGVTFYFLLFISEEKNQMPKYDIETVTTPKLETATSRIYLDQLDLLEGRKIVSCFFHTTNHSLFTSGKAYTLIGASGIDSLDASAHGTGASLNSPCSTYMSDDTGNASVCIKVKNPDLWAINDTLLMPNLTLSCDSRGNLIADGSESITYDQRFTVKKKEGSSLEIVPIGGMTGTEEMEGIFVVPSFTALTPLYHIGAEMKLESISITIANTKGEQVIKDLPLWCLDGSNFNNGIGLLYNDIEIDCSKSYIERHKEFNSKNANNFLEQRDYNEFPGIPLTFMLKRE